MFEGLRSAVRRFLGVGYVDKRELEALLKATEDALIDSDVELSLVHALTERVRQRSLEEARKGLSTREHVLRILYDELERLLGQRGQPRIAPQRILVAGLYGQGKTTSIAKIAKFFHGKGLKVGVIAGDVHRPAAIEQLRQLVSQVNAQFHTSLGKPAAIARSGVETLKDCDVLLFDSAGRSAFDEQLMQELKDVCAAFEPQEKWLVVSADLGQVAGKQARALNEAIGLTGVMVTRMDGSGKGGGALSSCAAAKIPVLFIGTGESLEALEVFDAKRFVARMLGFPDLEAIVERARAAAEQEAIARALEGELNYETFLEQLRAVKRIGPIKQIFQALGLYDLPPEFAEVSEAKLKAFEAAVLSMTPLERTQPALMRQQKRQERVARGAGIALATVKELVNAFDKSQKLLKALSKRGMAAQLGNLFKGFRLT